MSLSSPGDLSSFSILLELYKYKNVSRQTEHITGSVTSDL